MMKNNLSRIKQTFMHHKGLIAYLTAGDGGIKKTLLASLALIEGGVNLLEIGLPYSDPIADGPIIQRAQSRSLKAGTTLQDVLWLIQEIRKRSDIPLILFSYYNPILQASKINYLSDAKQAGIDGILIVDCPIEESEAIHNQCINLCIDPIYIITPSTPVLRIKKIAQYGRGFLYYACRNGTTGLRDMMPDDFHQKIKLIKTSVHLPVVVGFGVSHQKMALEVLKHADGVVVGSLFVKALEDGLDLPNLTKLARSIFSPLI